MLFLSIPAFAVVLNDNRKVSAVQASAVVNVKSEADILKAIQEANKTGAHIAIMGKQHSQGG